MNAPVASRRKKIALWVLIPATVLFVVSLEPAGMMILFSPMAFDAGETRAIWTFVITLWAYPVVVAVTVVAAWVSFGLRAYRLAMWWNVLPVVHAVVLAIEASFS